MEGERIARDAAARTGVEVVIARPSGIYGPGDRRLLKLFEASRGGGSSSSATGRSSTTSPTSTISSRAFACAARCPPPAGRTYILAGGEVPTLNELAAMIAQDAGVPPPACICPSGPSGSPARPAKPSARRSASSRRSTAAAWISSRRAAPSTSRGRGRSSGSRHRSDYAKGFTVRSRGTASKAGSSQACTLVTYDLSQRTLRAESAETKNASHGTTRTNPDTPFSRQARRETRARLAMSPRSCFSPHVTSSRAPRGSPDGHSAPSACSRPLREIFSVRLRVLCASALNVIKACRSRKRP